MKKRNRLLFFHLMYLLSEFHLMEVRLLFLQIVREVKRYGLYVLPLKEGEINKYELSGSIEFLDLSWSCDSERLVYISKTGKFYNVHTLSVSTGARVQVTETEEFKRDARWSYNSDYIAYFSMDENQKGHVALVSLKNRKIEKLTTGLEGVNSYPRPSPVENSLAFVSDGEGMKKIGIISFFEKEVSWLPFVGYEQNLPEWSHDGKKILYVSNIEGNMRLFEYSLSDHKTAPLGYSSGVTSSGSWSGDGKKIAFRYHCSEKPAEIYVTDGKEIKQVTYNFPEKVPSMISSKHIFYPSSDGEEIPAFLYVPEGDGPHPAVIWIHGGPASQHFNGWEPLFQLILSCQIAVLAPNIRGSTGRGREYEYAIYRDWGGIDLEDVLSGAAYLKGLDFIDSDKISIGGASYGGFMTMTALVKHPDLWACGINSIGPVNLATFYEHTSKWLRELLINKYGFKAPEEDYDFYFERSPIHFIQNITAPLLLIYSDDDVRVPKIEKDQLVDRLKEEGKEFDLVVFSDEGHSPMFSTQELNRYRLMIDFLKRHLLES